MEVPSSVTAAEGTLAALRASSTRAKVAASTFELILEDET